MSITLCLHAYTEGSDKLGAWIGWTWCGAVWRWS